MRKEIFNITYTIALDYIPIKDTDFCAWQLKKDYSELIPSETNEGICKISDIENASLPTFKDIRYDKDMFLVLVTNELLNRLKISNIGYLNDKDWKGKSITPYTDYKNQTHKNLIALNFSSHMYFKPDFKTPLTTAIRFDYIDSNMSNKYYDIKEVFNLLSTREDIKWNEKKILDVPYYNRSERLKFYIDFFWTPTQEEYEMIWEKCKSYNTEWPSTQKYQAIKELDLLNIKQFKKPEPKEYD